MSQGVGIEQNLAVASVVKDRNRHPPGALAGDAPVTPFLHHRLNSVSARRWGPGDLVDCLEGLLPKAFDGGEPLFSSTKDGWFFGAPVVGIAVSVSLLFQQGTGRVQGFDDRRIGVFEHIEAGKRPGLSSQGAGFIYWAEHRQTVFLACVEVVDTMPWCGVHEARS